MNKKMVERAKRFAELAHGLVLNEQGELGQRRKGTGVPYTEHLFEVAELVASNGGDETQVAAAWLHDVVEDTPVPLAHVRLVFGFDVAKVVDELTDAFNKRNYPDLNRSQRKAKEAARLASISDRAKTVKYADFISNLRNISQLPPKFGEVYATEVADTLCIMHGGNERLRSATLAAVEAALIWLSRRNSDI
jgi:(p)ppGpp synthase/HD superfamily hydrolase